MAMMGRDHNEKTEQEIYEDQQFLRGFTEIKELTSTMAGTKGDMGATYKRLKDLGWTKKDVEFALSLEDKDSGKVIAEFERKIRIAKLFGHALGRQLELIDDRAPQDDKAFEQGKAAGSLRKQNVNPYQPGSSQFQRWQEGYNEGTAFVNKELSSAMEGAGN
ncbi:conserved hypothetical protein [uncultured Pleomorphomonas sp.]|uniref:Uncharacterized protein n=2 Tax=uncultured Pleomorphomonas sp. TaxID=442121 RepID=A0A212LQI4_9HYPH|nr:conserved hypothetical protein [uncultured Pleomorphomonas sp.]